MSKPLVRPPVITRRYLIDEIMKDLDIVEKQLTYETVHLVATKFVEKLSDNIKEGKDVVLRGLGSFEIKEKEAHKAHNPQTLKPVTVPKHCRVFFKPGVYVKKALRKRKAKSEVI